MQIFLSAPLAKQFVVWTSCSSCGRHLKLGSLLDGRSLLRLEPMLDRVCLVSDVHVQVAFYGHGPVFACCSTPYIQCLFTWFRSPTTDWLSSPPCPPNRMVRSCPVREMSPTLHGTTANGRRLWRPASVPMEQRILTTITHSWQIQALKCGADAYSLSALVA